MAAIANGQSIKIFSTCPPSNLAEPRRYLAQVEAIARWSEAAGCEGILVYTDNGLIDAWLVSQIIIERTERLCPLVAVQAVYMHPYSVAKMVASFGFLYGRRVYLNMVAGGFKNDLNALNDPTPHDERYARLVEYTALVLDLLKGPGPITLAGRYYGVTNLKMTPPLPAELVPGVFVSGSSAAGLEAARKLGATAVQYPKPAAEYTPGTVVDDNESGIRVGIIAREDGDEAWRVARERFPENRKGQITHQLAMKVSDSAWHKQLSELGKAGYSEENPYWLVPFENYKTFCPYLVGSYQRVADELARYMSVGYRTFILDVPANPEELEHIRVAFDRAGARVTS
ncbi:MAG: LLM class flavin-dependent oxidoreductase [Gemmatimonadales bacterium]